MKFHKIGNVFLAATACISNPIKMTRVGNTKKKKINRTEQTNKILTQSFVIVSKYRSQSTEHRAVFLIIIFQKKKKKRNK